VGDLEDNGDLEPEACAVDEGVIAEQVPKPKEVQVFARKPLTFLHEWLATRRKGQDFASTPMGHVCQGKPLKADHPFFMKAEVRQAELRGVGSGPVKVLEEDDDVDEGSDEEGHGHGVIDNVDAFDDTELKEEEEDAEKSG